MTENEKKYIEHETERKKYTNQILNSSANKKVVIAGPGTGKSFLFQQICEQKYAQGEKNNLALSFINELINDLKKDLYGLADVKTLHSFALSRFPKTNNNFYLNLGSIIEEDYEIINNKKISFTEILCNLLDSKDDLKFYSERRKYYNFFSPNCSIYSLVKAFEKNKDLIPVYSQILIDEFQDFNKLEIKLIELLAEKNQILIAGDDDQSLYSFKFAVPSEIRAKHTSLDYESFELPFCSRCTDVIIKAFNEIVAKAKDKGFLQERIDKQYKYFACMEKDKISNENPKIYLKKKVFQSSTAFHIEKEIGNIFNPKNKNASILIICPLKKQISNIETRLKAKGFCNIQTSLLLKQDELLDGYNLILKNKDCNLGYRIITKYIEPKNEFVKIIQKSHQDDETIQFKNYLNKEILKKIYRISKILKKVNDDKALSTEEENILFDCFGYNPNKIALEKFKTDFNSKNKSKIYKDIPIRITTILGSKGLTSDYVFLVNFEDKYILDDGGKKITDENICKFLVAMTRAKKRIYIFTGENKLPEYVSWINNNNYQEI